jgi:cytochrome c oxidase assembly protein subunit 11
MVGMAFAAVPLYDMFCRVTGFGGTTQQATGVVGEVLDREVTVFFDANTAPGLDWSFEPLQRSQRIKLGENGLAFYEVTNVSDRPLIGTATYNVTPNKTGVFFAKIECFCFTEQRLEPGESMQMPVSYFVDPRLDEERNLDDVTQITLSYTFFKVGEGEQETAALAE